MKIILNARRVLLAVLFIILTNIFASTVSIAKCLESTMKQHLSGPCVITNPKTLFHYRSFEKLTLLHLWKLDIGAMHPPTQLPPLQIEQLLMESIWGLQPGETVIRNPSWGLDRLQPHLEASASLRHREIAMSLSMIKTNQLAEGLLE